MSKGTWLGLAIGIVGLLTAIVLNLPSIQKFIDDFFVNGNNSSTFAFSVYAKVDGTNESIVNATASFVAGDSGRYWNDATDATDSRGKVIFDIEQSKRGKSAKIMFKHSAYVSGPINVILDTLAQEISYMQPILNQNLILPIEMPIDSNDDNFLSNDNSEILTYMPVVATAALAFLDTSQSEFTTIINPLTNKLVNQQSLLAMIRDSNYIEESKIFMRLARTTYLSDLIPIDSSNIHGKLSLDQTYLGNEIEINGKSFKKGLGMHTPSRGLAKVSYKLDKKYTHFAAYVGWSRIPRTTCSNINIEFEIWGDGKKLRSAHITRADMWIEFSENVASIKTLTLVTKNGSNRSNNRNDNSCNHAVWGAARVTK